MKHIYYVANSFEMIMSPSAFWPILLATFIESNIQCVDFVAEVSLSLLYTTWSHSAYMNSS